MNLRKITEREANHKKSSAAKKPAIRVFSGNRAISISVAGIIDAIKINANTFRWFVLVPENLANGTESGLNWNAIFRTAHKNRMINRSIAGLGSENLEYKSFNLANGSVLFAFK